MFEGFWPVVKKEIKEVIKDRRALAGIILGPILIVVLSFLPVQLATSNVTKQKILIVDEDNSSLSHQLIMFIKFINNSEVYTKNNIPNDINSSLKNGIFDLAIIIPKNFYYNISKGGTSSVFLLFDASSIKNIASLQPYQAIIEQFSDFILSQRLEKLNLNMSFVKPIVAIPIAANLQNASSSLSLSYVYFYLPFSLIIAGMSFSTGIALEKTVGEKEKGTFELLLSNAPSRSAVLLGKVASISFGSLLSMLTGILSLFLVREVSTELNFGFLSLATQSNLPSSIELSLVVFTVFLASLLMAFIYLAIGFFSKSVKEAQTYSIIPSLLFTLPMAFAWFLPASLTKYFKFLPVFGSLFGSISFLVTSDFSEIIIPNLVNFISLILLYEVNLKLIESEKVVTVRA
ncbi:MAG: ABC transporter permease [Candidatus Brockarchaeota archaeon]|nr:ABC transporter permease [Candidatus Brockarchaeota archaeon]MBO3768067.1 ABC transporter permease [Candidatus Brockarchaeota archaeon]MBO3802242.1 ABC transporter permease [Candidatus Brockarchaeota archaeon]